MTRKLLPLILIVVSSMTPVACNTFDRAAAIVSPRQMTGVEKSSAQRRIPDDFDAPAAHCYSATLCELTLAARYARISANSADFCCRRHREGRHLDIRLGKNFQQNNSRPQQSRRCGLASARRVGNAVI